MFMAMISGIYQIVIVDCRSKVKLLLPEMLWYYATALFMNICCLCTFGKTIGYLCRLCLF